jgi:HD-like signal output (HDOD) protein
MTVEPGRVIRAKLETMRKMPSIPAILDPLLRYLERPPEQVSVNRIVDLISQDESLAAQCLQFANSPLFGRWQRIDSIRGAVVSIGIRRMQDIALSCCLLRIMPTGKSRLDPVVFWEHSLGCALLARRFAGAAGYGNPDRAYLAGLLHDIGILVNLWVLPEEFERVMELAQTEKIGLDEAEVRVLGLTHCETGSMLAQRWKFTPEIAEVIRCHHDVSRAQVNRDLVALIALNDLLCRMHGLGYGFEEHREVDIQAEPAFAILMAECAALKSFDWARYTFELEGHLEEVRSLVSKVFRHP